MQAKKSGINSPPKYRSSMHRDVVNRCRFLLCPALAVTAGSGDLPCIHCMLPYILSGIKEINSKLCSQTFSISFLF